MDPIHPITPVVPHLLPVLPSPKVGAVEREAPQDRPDRRRRKRPTAGSGAGEPERYEQPAGGAGEPELYERPGGGGDLELVEEAGDDDGLGHVDLTV